MAIDENGRWEVGSTPYNIRAGTLLSIYGLYVIYVVVTFTMFVIKARDKHSGLEQRNPRLVTMQAVGCFLMGTVGMISTSIQQWPCFLKLWFCNIGFLLTYGAVAARAFQHIVVSNVHILTNKVASTNNPAFAGVVPQTNFAFLSQNGGTAVGRANGNNAGYFSQMPTRQHRSNSQSSIFSHTEFALSDNTTAMAAEDKKHTLEMNKTMRITSLCVDHGSEVKLYRQLHKYTRLQRYATDRALTLFVLCHLLVALIMSLAINIVNNQFALSPTSMTCKMVWGFLPVIAIVAVYVVIVMPVLLFKCWKLRDAYGIRNDLAASITLGGLCIILTVIWETVLFHLALRWSGWFFTWVCAIILHSASIAIPLWAAIRHSRDVIRRMHGASSLGTPMAVAIAGVGGHDMSKRSEFNTVLADPYEYRFFCDFAASCFCSEMTAFIDEYQALKGLTIVSLASEDIWRSDASHLEPEYMARMTTNIDSNMGYLAMAGLNNQSNVQALRIQTPPTVSILETACAAYPQYELSELTPFPVAAMDKLVALFSVFINSSSTTAVSLPSAMVLRIRERLGRSQLTLVILDEIKDEILNMLYFDVFTRYSRKN
ncbi:hypothetical protein H4R24_000556 [Coemansia sp. RSA 988]|nr:hypothetical protein H4R24_000556 [Coemansia sp. RSA 988]